MSKRSESSYRIRWYRGTQMLWNAPNAPAHFKIHLSLFQIVSDFLLLIPEVLQRRFSQTILLRRIQLYWVTIFLHFWLSVYWFYIDNRHDISPITWGNPTGFSFTSDLLPYSKWNVHIHRLWVCFNPFPSLNEWFYSRPEWSVYVYGKLSLYFFQCLISYYVSWLES